MKKIIVAHPGRQHSFRLATALKQQGILYKYLTTIYNKESSISLHIIDKITFGKLRKSIQNRRCEYLNDSDVVQYHNILALITLFLVRVNNGGKLYNFWNDFVTDLFGRKVAKFAIKNKVDVVIMYDTTADECFRILREKAPNIELVIDSSAACNEYVIKTFENDTTITPLSEIKNEAIKFWDSKTRKKLALERKCSDVFLVPSQYCKNSLRNYLESNTKVYVVPYGSNFPVEYKTNFFENGYLNFIFVGQVSYRKGAHYLLEAFEHFSNMDDVILHMVGMYNPHDTLYKKYCKQKNIVFHGFLAHDNVRELFKKCDVMIIPSLSEGMTLSGLEGMSQGLPLICTANSGVNDLIEDYKNGIIVSAQSSDELVSSVQWFVFHKDMIPEMSRNVSSIIKENTWERYYKQMGELCESVL